MEKSNFFSYTGLHFKLCSLELRELFSVVFKPEILSKTLRKYLKNFHEFVPLYTCNRFDICIFGEITRDEMIEVFYDLALQAMRIKFDSLPMCHMQLRDHISNSLRFSVDQEGVNIFFRVAASLDSLVLGETQILGQLKTAYQNAQKYGFSSKKAAQIFNHCFKTSKRVRSETDLFKHVISIGHLAVTYAQKEFVDIRKKNIVIFGAGEMSTLTARHFLFHNASNLFIANRTLKKAEWICQKLNAGKALLTSDALKNLDQFDICITAYGGDELLITKENLAYYAQCRGKNLSLFIDISVPRKIDNSFSSKRNIKVINIDELSSVVEKNKEARKSALLAAESIILEEVSFLLAKQQQHEQTKNLREFNAWLNQVVEQEIEKFLQKKNNTQNPKITSSIVARAICKKVSTKIKTRSDLT